MLLGIDEISAEARQRLQDSLVLVHGGMAQNAGPILEMVTEKYLLRAAKEWHARGEAITLMHAVIAALKAGDMRQLGAITTQNFTGPIQTIIPWATTRYTEGLIHAVKERFGAQFWGFWMLGGMSGGGMGFIVDPAIKSAAQVALQEIMDTQRLALQHALPFAMKPVVYDFSINERGTWAEVLPADYRLMPVGYYALHMPRLLRADAKTLNMTRRRELDYFGNACLSRPELARVVPMLFDRILPHVSNDTATTPRVLDVLHAHGFDRELHEQIRTDMKIGRIGLMQNRLPASSTLRDVDAGDVVDATTTIDARIVQIGRDAIASGAVAVVSLAGGAGSRWTQGAGVVKALHRLQSLRVNIVRSSMSTSPKVVKLCAAMAPHQSTYSRQAI
jgi:hypothetical protein